MLEIKDIAFSYDKKRFIIDGLNLEFKEGGIYGLLGKNGTGKSTLLYLMMGLLRPSRGQILMDGKNPADRDPKTLMDMFIVPEEYDLPHVKLWDYVKVIRPFYPNMDEQVLKDCLEVFEMNQNYDLGSLSMGQKKKIYICFALSARTKVLLMDEPTNGLDIPSKSQFRKAIARGSREDQIIIISTHQVRDVETLLDHVTMIDDNRVLMNEPLDPEVPVNLEELFTEKLNAYNK